MQEIHTRMLQEIAQAGERIEAVLCCPHPEEAGCGCRKPTPGLLVRAHEEYRVDLGQAILVGDSVKDVQTAAAIGMPVIMVLSGIGRASDLGSAGSPPCWVADDLNHAARLILNDEVLPPGKRKVNQIAAEGLRMHARG